MYRRLWVENLRLEAVGLTQLSNEDVGLRQLAASTAIEPLRILASVLQPVGFSQRYRMQHTNQLTPMDHLVDAIRPDPPSRHGVELLVKKYLVDHDAQAADKLQTIFAHWAVAGPQAQAIMSSRPLLKPVEPRAEQLTNLGKIGVEALLYLSKNETAPSGWAQTQLSLIDEAQ
jgi:hexosaminidase